MLLLHLLRLKMPLYDWKCSCGTEQELFRKLADPLPVHCGEFMTKMVVSKIALKDPSGRGLGWCNEGYKMQADGHAVGVRCVTKKFEKGKQVI